MQAEPPPEKERGLTYGVEIASGSGHADRGFVISDRPVVQPEMWVSRSGTEFSLWSNFTLAETTDASRPTILEMELTHEHKQGRISIRPAVTMVFYRDAPSAYSSRSIEAWLHMTCDVGPFRLFTNHSLDVLTYRGAYYGEAGIGSERRVSPRVRIGGSLGAGWASSKFNDSYAAVAKSALNRVFAEGWLTAHVNRHFYIGPQVEFSAIVDRGVRAGADVVRPTYVLVKLTTGGEF